MKTGILSLVLFAFVSGVARGQSAEPHTYYAVIGAFAKVENAINYTDKANKNNFSAQYAIHTANNLYYVYILSTTDRKKAYAFLIKIRVETAYKDCWLYIGTLGEETETVVEKPIEKPIEKPVEPVVKKDSVVFEPVITPPVDSATIKPVETPKPVVKKPEGKPFYFKLLNKESGNEVQGEVHLQESTRATQYQAFQANQVSYVKAPTNQAGVYTVITNAPGYQQITTTLLYNDPTVLASANGEYIIPLDLRKAKAGDYIDFNNVRFIVNTSIMTPESANELDGLVALMKENPKYKIKIHGHCNGKNDREIIEIGTSTNYFALDPTHNKRKKASDTELSEQRANSVKGYLVSQGIEAGRIKTKAEGGRIPLYDVGSALSPNNDRVEIEVKKG